jgi:hypothetical protein
MLDKENFEGEHLQNIRTSVANVIRYVNEHGGGTILIWVKQGVVVDQALQDMFTSARYDVITSETIAPHII